MRENESRWRRRQRGYHALAAGGGLFGGFLLLAGLTPANTAWVFGVLAFAGLIAGCRQALKLWNVDSSPHGTSPSFEILSNSFRTFSPAPRDSSSVKWLLLSRRDRRRARWWVTAGVGAFLGAVFAGGRSVPPSPVFWGIAAFVAFVFCVRKAMALWRVDEMVFDHRLPWNPEPRESRSPSTATTPMTLRRTHVAHIVAFAILGTAAARSVQGQQTIFNVPTADVLDKGKLYLETDWLWRPSDPAFAAGAPIRGVYGFGGNIEGGINFAGIVTPGRSAPVAIPNIKWQPLKTDTLSLTTGALGQFFLRGTSDGTPSVLTYAHAAVKLPIGTRLTAGGWWASSDYASPGATAGGLFGFEQPITPNVTLAADWYTGNSSLGYVSPGVIVTAGRWVFYGAYSIKNGDSKGNGLLLELGFNVP